MSDEIKIIDIVDYNKVNLRPLDSNYLKLSNINSYKRSEFRINNSAFHEKFFESHPFFGYNIFHDTDRNGKLCSRPTIILAGGSVLKTLSVGVNHSSDLDFYIIGEQYCGEENRKVCLERAKKWINEVNHNLKNSKYWEDIKQTLIHTQNDYHWDIQFTLGDEKYKLQLMKNPYPTPEALMKSFDIDCCCLMFDGDRVTMTTDAAIALRTNTIKINFKNYYYNYEIRVAKYVKRYHFDIAFPQLTRNDLTKFKVDTSNHFPKINGKIYLIGKFMIELDQRELEFRRIINGSHNQMFRQCKYNANKQNSPCDFCDKYKKANTKCSKFVNPESGGYDYDNRCYWNEKLKTNYLTKDNKIVNPTLILCKLNSRIGDPECITWDYENNSVWLLIISNIPNDINHKELTYKEIVLFTYQHDIMIDQFTRIIRMDENDIINKISNHPCTFVPNQYYYDNVDFNDTRTIVTNNKITNNYFSEEIIGKTCELLKNANSDKEIENICNIIFMFIKRVSIYEIEDSMKKYGINNERIDFIMKTFNKLL